MHILFYFEGDSGSMLQAFRDALPQHTVHAWTSHDSDAESASAGIADSIKAQVTIALAWMPPNNFFDGLVNLTHVFAISAGVDHLLKHPGLPSDIPLIRLKDAGMATQIAEYALYGVLYAQRNMHELSIAQKKSRWTHELNVVSAADTRVGILGAGALGARVAGKLVLNGYPVSCWSRTEKQSGNGISNVYGAAALEGFLANTDVLICLLPLTPETTGILNAQLFSQLPRGCYLINPGRGDHLIEQDLLDALESGQLSGALLDVFSVEPLPETHRFWSHPRIVITPHVAAKSLVDESVGQIVNNIDALQRGELPSGLVDRQTGY